MEIKDIREKAGLSRKEFCELTDVPYRTLQDWERCLRTPPEYLITLIDFKVRHRDLD